MFKKGCIPFKVHVRRLINFYQIEAGHQPHLRVRFHMLFLTCVLILPCDFIVRFNIALSHGIFYAEFSRCVLALYFYVAI